MTEPAPASEHDGPGGLETLDDGGVVERPISLQDPGPAGARHTRDGDDVLDRHREAVERAALGGVELVERSRARERPVDRGLEERTDALVELAARHVPHAKLVASTATYPHEVIRARLQHDQHGR